MTYHIFKIVQSLPYGFAFKKYAYIIIQGANCMKHPTNNIRVNNTRVLIIWVLAILIDRH